MEEDVIFSFNSEKIRDVCRRYHVLSLRIFGSVAKGSARQNSDIDILVSFTKQVSLLHLVRLERELSGILGAPVDLVTEKALSPYFRDQVLSDAKVIYDAA